MTIAVTYTILALIAIAVNISSQDVFLQVYAGAYAIELSVLLGTIVGLLVKYALDKKYIFKFEGLNILHETYTFLLYTLMGVLTTFMFWGFEFSFNLLFRTEQLRYLGGVVGLAIGYWMKYHLDKRFVFSKKTKT
jgi:hypothetical protein